MKITVTCGEWRVTRKNNLVTRHPSSVAAFTMVEIAISLAVIGIALVAILGVLPLGMRVQRDNREQTVLNQDATVFIEAIRNGARGVNDLTNYVYAITNYWTHYSAAGSVAATGANGYDYYNATVGPGYLTPSGQSGPVGDPLNTGARIVGLLTTPEFVDLGGLPVYFPADTNGVSMYQYYNADYYSNHVVAYVHSISGPAVEKPPQDSTLLRNSSFSYKLFCVNAPLPLDIDSFHNAYGTNVVANLHEMRLTFLWPLQPNGVVGPNLPITFRTSIAGRLTQYTNLYFYQSQYFDTNNIVGP